ncbi:MAG: hypothetical protein WCW01_02815 [Gammaproteobacteria bacterium]
MFFYNNQSAIIRILTNAIRQDRTLSNQDKITLSRHLENNNYSLLLRCACQGGSLPLLDALQKHSSSINLHPNEHSQNGNTALHWVASFFTNNIGNIGFKKCWKKVFEIVKRLYLMGVDPNTQNLEGRTFLEPIIMSLRTKEKEKIFDDFSDFLGERYHTGRNAIEEQQKIEAWNHYIQLPIFYDPLLYQEEVQENSWIGRHPVFIFALIAAGIFGIISSQLLRPQLPKTEPEGPVDESPSNSSITLFRRQPEPIQNNQRTPIDLSQINYSKTKASQISVILRQKNKITFDKKIEPLMEMSKERVRKELLAAIESEAKDLSPTCIDTLLCMMRRPNFRFLITELEKNTGAELILPGSPYSKVDETVRMSFTRFTSSMEIKDYVENILFHELLVHRGSILEDVAALRPHPGTFHATQSFLLAAVQRDKLHLKKISALTSQAIMQGISSLSKKEREELSNYIELLKTYYIPTTAWISKGRFSEVEMQTKSNMESYIISRPMLKEEIMVKIKSWEQMPNGETKIFTRPIYSSKVEGRSWMDQKLLLLADFLADCNLQIASAEANRPLTLAAEYIAYFNGIFRGDIEFAKIFIPNIIEYLSKNYQTVGCLCETQRNTQIGCKF